VDDQNPKQASGRLPYMVQLDALRAFAVFGVLFAHFYMAGKHEVLPLAHWSVQLFFVLSGFLITGILLRCRGLSSTRKGGLGQLRQFYIRRTLRIFPVFYLVVLISALANVPPVRETLVWLVTYTSNVYFALRGSWHGPINHFWTLAVEEQFYLIWPCLILFVSDKYLLPSIITVVLVAPLYKISGIILGWNEVAREVMTFANLDSLGIGALLALYRHRNISRFQSLGRHRAYFWVGPILAAIVITLLFAPSHLAFVGAVADLFLAILFAWVIHKASVGFRGIIGYLLETRLLLHCGKISYGIYVYHNFVPRSVRDICHRFHLTYPREPGWRLVLFATLTILIATLSWLLFEQPINNLKKRFRYSKP
jgi:peptidoglycan/LPS O-acetylase OafA/YrhL